jgi:hypothetical protein
MGACGTSWGHVADSMRPSARQARRQDHRGADLLDQMLGEPFALDANVGNRHRLPEHALGDRADSEQDVGNAAGMVDNSAVAADIEAEPGTSQGQLANSGGFPPFVSVKIDVLDVRPKDGRSGGIRTHDPQRPMLVRYQAAPRSDRTMNPDGGYVAGAPPSMTFL